MRRPGGVGSGVCAEAMSVVSAIQTAKIDVKETA